MCCYPAVAAAAALPLAAAVRHRVPCDTIGCCCGLLHLIPVCLSSFKRDLLLMYPVTVYRLPIRLPAKVSADFAGSLIGSL